MEANQFSCVHMNDSMKLIIYLDSYYKMKNKTQGGRVAEVVRTPTLQV
jgi:hypothetical protein